MYFIGQLRNCMATEKEKKFSAGDIFLYLAGPYMGDPLNPLIFYKRTLNSVSLQCDNQPLKEP